MSHVPNDRQGTQHTQRTSAKNFCLDQGDLTESRRFHQEALELQIQLFGESHVDVANSLNNLAVVGEKEEKNWAEAGKFRCAHKVYVQFSANATATSPNL